MIQFLVSVFHCNMLHIPIKMLSLSSEEDDWNIVIKECSSLAAKWDQLSAFIGLSMRLIEETEKNHPNDKSGCWNDALKHWIRQDYKTDKFGLPSWRTLLDDVATVDKLYYSRN